MSAIGQAIDWDRRRLLSSVTIGVVAASTGSLFSAQLLAAPAGDAIRPFRINIPEEQLVDLRKRISATRWPDRETVTDRSQGVQLAKFQETMRYWASDYDWRKLETRLNALPQFITEIDGLDFHFIHVRSKHEDAPGALIETSSTSTRSTGAVTSPPGRSRSYSPPSCVLPSVSYGLDANRVTLSKGYSSCHNG
ncbi:epoxide hydrolase N-terminal domain-containing protein [Bradyrhizobium liaoningense]|uniref:epoxide hydrolase N-terminal domain-containing protein n=1 Tax=Bradyrhizobium liaoningense TaxID=43992 RepID=UPI001BA8CEB4|nr:epoxide hydrolase N-terminal domain-containing protein [Bradyrhizobium liaoningense]